MNPRKPIEQQQANRTRAEIASQKNTIKTLNETLGVLRQTYANQIDISKRDGRQLAQCDKVIGNHERTIAKLKQCQIDDHQLISTLQNQLAEMTTGNRNRSAQAVDQEHAINTLTLEKNKIARILKDTEYTLQASRCQVERLTLELASLTNPYVVQQQPTNTLRRDLFCVAVGMCFSIIFLVSLWITYNVYFN